MYIDEFHARSFLYPVFLRHPRIDLQYVICIYLRPINSARTCNAWLSGQDLHHVQLAVYPKHIQRNQGVFHPEIIEIGFGEDEKHPGHLRHGCTVHQPLLVFSRGTGELYQETSVAAADPRFIINILMIIADDHDEEHDQQEANRDPEPGYVP